MGSIGESIAAGAIFTIPAFLMAGCWSDFATPEAWARSSALMIVGGLLGHLFRHAAASCYGRGPGPSFSGIDRGSRDPQGRPEGTRRSMDPSGP